MGGQGALICALKNPGMFQSVSAFSPIAYASTSAWGQKAFSAYLGNDRNRWEAYDATLLAQKYSGPDLPVLIDQGLDDEWYHKGELDVESFFEAASAAKIGAINLRKQPGYDHSYFFIATFIADHIAFHAKALKSDVWRWKGLGLFIELIDDKLSSSWFCDFRHFKRYQIKII